MPDRLRVLVVDDAADLRSLLRLAFERDGWDVAEAEDGQRAIEVAREHAPHVVLLDLAMPVMDGLEALPSLRELCPDARIVVLSGAGAAQTTRRALAAGADGYLQKGGSVRTVIATVRDLLHAGAPGETASEGAPDGVPAGVVTVLDEPLFRIVSTDPTADAVLGRPLPPGVPLFAALPRLASLLRQHRAGGSFTADLGPGPVTVRVEPHGRLLRLHVCRGSG